MHKWIALLALASWLAAPGSGSVPKVTLSLKQVNLTDAVSAVNKATSAGITIQPPTYAPTHPASLPRDLKWREATLSNVIRELCARFDVGAYVEANGATRLSPISRKAPLLRPLSISSRELRGVRVAVERVELQSLRGQVREGPPAVGFGGSTFLTLSCRSETLGRGELAGVTQIVAKDEMGNLLLEEFPSSEPPRPSGFPDEVLIRTRLSLPHPNAKKLVWLEGQLPKYEFVRTIEGRLPLPFKAKEKVFSQHGVTIEGVEFLAGPPTSLRLKITHPQKQTLRTMYPGWGYGVYPNLIGVSGNVYAPQSTSGAPIYEGGNVVHTATWSFPAISDSIEAVGFRLYLQEEPRPFIRFRMTDIPLPTPRDAKPAPATAAVVSKPLETSSAGPRRLPSLGMKLENVTAPDAAAELHKATGLSFVVSESEPSAARASFDWSQSTWVEALRDLQKSYDLGMESTAPGSFTLRRGLMSPTRLIAKRPVEFVNSDVRVSLQGINQHEAHHRIFTAPTNHGSFRTLQVSLGLRSGRNDPFQWARVANIRAEDDRGRILRGGPGSSGEWRAGFGAPPDELTTGIALPPPHPSARRLKTLEGDLLVFRDVQIVRESFPTPLSASPQKREFDGGAMEVWGHLPSQGGDGLSANVRLTLNRSEGSIREVRFAPIGQSGKRYSPTSARGSIKEVPPVAEQTLAYRHIPEPIIGVEVITLWRAGLQRLMRFRLENLPLPTESPFRPLARLPFALGNRSVLPLFDPNGGSLRLKVRLANSAAPPGFLRVGLIAKNGPMQWLDVKVAPDGTALLESTRAGVYRLLQAYQPDTAPEARGPGRWLNAESTIAIKPGKATQAPELRWSDR